MERIVLIFPSFIFHLIFCILLSFLLKSVYLSVIFLYLSLFLSSQTEWRYLSLYHLFIFFFYSFIIPFNLVFFCLSCKTVGKTDHSIVFFLSFWKPFFLYIILSCLCLSFFVIHSIHHAYCFVCCSFKEVVCYSSVHQSFDQHITLSGLLSFVLSSQTEGEISGWKDRPFCSLHLSL